MPDIAVDERLRWQLLSHLRNARTLTDDLFQLIRPEALYERPIAEHHRIVFYLGHMEAFDWNLIGAGSFGMDSPHKEFDRLFALVSTQRTATFQRISPTTGLENERFVSTTSVCARQWIDA